MADDHTYEIFKKSADNTTVSVETVKGLEEAGPLWPICAQTPTTNIICLTHSLET